MPILLYIIVRSIIGGLICLIPSGGINYSHAEVKGYRDIIFHYGKFLAVGTEGRIDYITNLGERTAVVCPDRNNLNCITSNDREVVVAGDNGTILFSSDGIIFSLINSRTNSDINGITFKNGLFVAGADDGTILISRNGKSWNIINTEAIGNIVSVTASESYFIGVTERGEILTSKDGFNWNIKNYNKEYEGYQKSCVFKDVIAANNRIVIIGMHDDNSPAVLISTLGNVWTERSLVYDDNQGIMKFLTNEPNSITYDSARDQFILACDNGEIFTLPSCSKCNESAIISDCDLYGIICTGNLLICVGQEFSINIMNL